MVVMKGDSVEKDFIPSEEENIFPAPFPVCRAYLVVFSASHIRSCDQQRLNGSAVLSTEIWAYR
jgi:hypothetical protein